MGGDNKATVAESRSVRGDDYNITLDDENDENDEEKPQRPPATTTTTPPKARRRSSFSPVAVASGVLDFVQRQQRKILSLSLSRHRSSSSGGGGGKSDQPDGGSGACAPAKQKKTSAARRQQQLAWASTSSSSSSSVTIPSPSLPRDENGWTYAEFMAHKRNGGGGGAGAATSVATTIDLSHPAMAQATAIAAAAATTIDGESAHEVKKLVSPAFMRTMSSDDSFYIADSAATIIEEQGASSEGASSLLQIEPAYVAQSAAGIIVTDENG